MLKPFTAILSKIHKEKAREIDAKLSDPKFASKYENSGEIDNQLVNLHKYQRKKY